MPCIQKVKYLNVGTKWLREQGTHTSHLETLTSRKSMWLFLIYSFICSTSPLSSSPLPSPPPLRLSSLLATAQFSSVAQLCTTLCNPMDWSMPGLPVHHQLLEFTQTPLHWMGDAMQPSHPLSSPSPLALNLSQHQGLFRWVISSHQVAKVLEFQFQHPFFQWTLRTDLL